MKHLGYGRLPSLGQPQKWATGSVGTLGELPPFQEGQNCIIATKTQSRSTGTGATTRKTKTASNASTVGLCSRLTDSVVPRHFCGKAGCRGTQQVCLIPY